MAPPADRADSTHPSGAAPIPAGPPPPPAGEPVPVRPVPRVLPYVALGVVWVVWGSTYLAMRIAVSEMPPLAAAGVRFGAAGCVMALVARVVDRRHGPPGWRQILDYALIGVLLLAVGNALVMWAEQTVPSSIAALIVATVPVWLLFFDGLRPGGQPWTGRVWLGTVIGLAGVALVARPPEQVSREHWLAIAGLQLACLAWTAGSLYAQAVPKRLPLASAAAVEMLAGAAVLVVVSPLFGEDVSRLAEASSRAWGGLAYLAAFGSLVGFTAFAYCLNELPASTVGTYAYVNPVIAVILGALVLGEAVTPGLLSGGGLILVAVLLTTVRPPRRSTAAVADRSEP
jgi:drug/metabolite transporter (DMT)-like permease